MPARKGLMKYDADTALTPEQHILIRESIGYSRKQLAKKLSITPRMVRYLEDGHSRISETHKLALMCLAKLKREEGAGKAELKGPTCPLCDAPVDIKPPERTGPTWRPTWK